MLRRVHLFEIKIPSSDFEMSFVIVNIFTQKLFSQLPLTFRVDGFTFQVVCFVLFSISAFNWFANVNKLTPGVGCVIACAFNRSIVVPATGSICRKKEEMYSGLKSYLAYTPTTSYC